MTDSPVRETPAPLRVTVVENSPEAPLGRVEDWLADAGAAVTLVRPHAGDDVPAAGDAGDALIVLGGLMDAYADERAPWLPATRALLVDAVENGLPTLGICLGHQLLAVALGGRVEVGAAAGPERGATEVTWAAGAAEDPVLGPAVRASGGRATVYEFHNDAVAAAPRGATVLASSQRHTVQAFRVGSALGVQFHPEASLEILGRWLRRTRELDAADVEAMEAEARRVDESAAAVGRGLVEGLLAQAAARG